MEEVSESYNPYASEIRASARAQFELIDVDAADMSSAAVNIEAVPFTELSQVTDKITENTRKLASLEQDLWALDGSFSLPNDDASNGETGYWSDAISDENGNIDLSFTFSFDEAQSSKGFTVIFDTKTQEVAADFTISVYNGSTLLNLASVVGNSEVFRIVDCPAENYNLISLNFTKTAKPYRRIRLTEFVFGYLQEFSADKIVNLKAIYETSLYMENLPTNKLELTIDNTDRAYNVLNPTGIYRYLQEGQGLNASVTINGDTVSLGRFFFETATANSNALTATIVGYDALYGLSETYFTGSTDTGKIVVDGQTYYPVEYIESSGTQYIDTGFKPNQDTRAILSAYNNSTSSGWTFGAWASASSKQYAFNCLGSYGFRYGSASAAITTVPVGDVFVDFNKNSYNINGTAGTIAEQTFVSDYPMYLFCINAAGSPSGGKFYGRVEFAQIYDNGTLARDFAPYRDENSAGYLYDKVGKQIYANKGTGTFAVGADLPESDTWSVEEAVQAVIADSGINVEVNIPADIGARLVGKNIPAETTHREALRLIVQAGMTNIYVNRLNQLTAKDFVFDEALDFLTAANMQNYGDAQDAGLINTVILTVPDDSEAGETIYTATNQTASQPYRAITVTNPLALGQEVAEWILTNVSRRNKYTLQTMGNPARDIADCISIANVYGTSGNAVVLRQETTYNGSVLDTVTAR